MEGEQNKRLIEEHEESILHRDDHLFPVNGEIRGFCTVYRGI